MNTSTQTGILVRSSEAIENDVAPDAIMSKTHRIAIDLSPKALEAMRARVESGEYADEGAVVEAAVRLLEGEDVSRRLEQLRQRVQRSVTDGKEPLSADEVERRMTAFVQQVKSAR